MAQRNPLKHEGKVYDLDVHDVARIAGRSPRWAYVHYAALGGVKRSWDGTRRVQIRFASKGLRSALKNFGVKPVEGATFEPARPARV